MTRTTQNSLNKPNTIGTDVEKLETQRELPIQLSSDEDFLKLREFYQNADFAKCKEIITMLEARYPEHPMLQKFREEIEMRKTVKSIAQSSKKGKKRENNTNRVRLAAFAFFSTLIVIITLFLSYFYFNTQVSARQINDESSQLAELRDQVVHLLLVGKPRPAAEALDRIRAINPDYEQLSELELQVYDLLLLETKYQSTIDLLEDDNHQEALALFREIENEWPGLWDVSMQIEKLEHRNNPEGE